ncbi:MAG TPA: plastocyanin/azurin family copper-binding protein [Actinomycetota bacterium]|nr:plastocyanin/azurin family copper-binding protein [Actinomycetota bacterium]
MDADDWRAGDPDEPMPVRRRLIDEVIATGVPAVSAAGAHRRRLWPAFLYLLIPAIALLLIYGLREPVRSKPGDAGGGKRIEALEDGPTREVSAQNIMFDTDIITLEPGTETIVHFENRDVSSIRHNIALYTDETAAEPIFSGEIISGGTSIDYEFESPAEGEYFFRCDVHPGMNGTVLVE